MQGWSWDAKSSCDEDAVNFRPVDVRKVELSRDGGVNWIFGRTSNREERTSTVCPVHLSTSPLVSRRICAPVLSTTELRARSVRGGELTKGVMNIRTPMQSQI